MFFNSITQTCRLCLLQKDHLVDLSDGLEGKIKSALNMEIISRSHWPQNICQDCDELLAKIKEYRTSVEHNQDFLIKFLGFDEIKSECKDEVDPEKEDNCSMEFDSNYEPLKDDESSNDSEDFVEEIKPKTKRKYEKNGRKATVKSPKKDTKNPPNIKTEPIVSIEEMDNVINSFMPLTCDYCNEEGFETLSSLQDHSRSQHKGNKRSFRARCGLCKNVYFSRTKYYRHILYHQNPDQFKCDLCDKSFKNQANLDLHNTMHLPDEDKCLECNVCHQRFKLQRQLKLHVQMHIPQNERKFKCEICSRAYVNASQLKEHSQISHSNYKPFVCEICAKGFPKLSVLRTHLKLTHGPQGPRVQCDQCLKYFANGTLLKRHVKMIHIENGVQECAICGHTSPNLRALKEHTKRQHEPESMRYPCKFCDKVMKSLKAKKEHEATHTGARLYTCKFCPKEFNSGANKYKHQKEKHPKEWAEWQKERNTANPT